MTDAPVLYQRVLLKLSGEALMGDGDFGIDPEVLARVADDLVELAGEGIELGLVIGGVVGALLLVAVVVMLAACAAGPNPAVGIAAEGSRRAAGFWLGLWHGLEATHYGRVGWHSHEMLFGYSGAVIAGFTFSISAITVPMLMDRQVDVFTAIQTSVRAVRCT